MKKTSEDTLHEERKAVREAFELFCPNVLGNPYYNGHWPLPAQQVFLGLHREFNSDEIFQALYGGAAGGGKSDALLMAGCQYAWKNADYAGVMFRKTFPDLTMPGALLDRALKWWVGDNCPGIVWEAGRSRFRFESGAVLTFAHMNNPLDHLKHQGAEYQFSAWDELTQWKDAQQYEYVGLSRLRRKAGSRIPLRTLSASNPGGPGHTWVQRKFVGGTDAVTGREIYPEWPYVPARVTDNPYIDREHYIRTLSHLHPTLVEQLLNGDWSARDPGDYFRREWFGELLDPDDCWPSNQCSRVRWWDLAASVKPDASRTAGVRLARHIHGEFAVEHLRHGRWTPGNRDDVIAQTAQADGKTVTVGIEIEGGSGGIAQFESLKLRLNALGFRVVGASPKGPKASERERHIVIRGGASLAAKAGRADPVSACLQRGYLRRGEALATEENVESPWYGADVGRRHGRDGVRCYAGTWNTAFFDAIEGFPPEEGKEGVDEVDALTGGHAYLTANPPGLRTPLHMPNPPQGLSPESPERHPDAEDDQDWDNPDMNDWGHYTP